MDAAAILDRLSDIGVTVRLSDDRLQIFPGSKVPPELLSQIRQHKAELVSRLRSVPTPPDGGRTPAPSKPKPAEHPPEWHAQEIAWAVEKEGVCVFWSDVFGELIAFIKDDSLRPSVPADLVAYTSEEILHVFGENKKAPSAKSLRLIHEAKRAGGGHITSYEVERND